ncbi:glycoside hydrolase family 19 protein [Pantoea anthophila]|uniref:glycoside hydrolase family 19 protein n=1 Tax=Pantoea anthophila TaxID=470931 RepID=UPI002787C076|nr:glycoside hydrolase family 19 protein [Pantoea anthophila]MDQ1212479.1 putative chitinase [Pantoea anthophila]
MFLDAIKVNEYDFSTRESTIHAIIEESRKQGLNLHSQIAYILATVKRETGDTFQPVREGDWSGHTSTDEYRRKHYRYYPYYGRGYVQITWDYNYKAYSEKLGVDLFSQPDKALEPNNALFILIDGFKNGVFTGKKLSDYVNDIESDFFNARKCINGLDHAAQIKEFANEFLTKLDSGELK